MIVLLLSMVVFCLVLTIIVYSIIISLDMDNELLKTKEVAKYLGVSKEQVLRMIKRKKRPLPAAKISTLGWRIRPSDLERWVESQIISNQNNPNES